MHVKTRLARIGLAAIPILAVSVAGTPAAMAQIAPAGTVIGNQATAIYETPAGVQVTVQSNLVETLINQVAAVDLDAAFDSVQAGGAVDALLGAKIASTAGGLVSFPHTIENLGNGTDVFDLTAPDSGSLTGVQIFADANGDGIADNATPITATPPLAPGEIFGIVVQATYNAGLALGEQDDPITVTAASQFNGQSDAVSDDITVQNGPVIVTIKEITPDSGLPGDTLTVTLTYTNSGNSAGVVRLKDPLPPQMTYVPGSATWSDGSGALTELADGPEQTSGTSDTIDFAVDLASVLGVDDEDGNGATDLNTVLFEVSDVPAGTTGSVTFNVTITTGTANGTYRNGIYSCDETSNGANCDPGDAGPNPPFTVDPEIGLTFADSQSTADTPRAGAGLGDPYADPAGLLGGALQSGTGAGADTDGNTSNDVVEDDGTNGNTTDPVTSNSAWAEGSEIPFSFILSNDSNATETFNLTERATTGLIAGPDFPAQTAFRFETPSGLVILDTDGDGNPDVTIPSGQAVEVVLIADLPVGGTRAAADPAWLREVIATSQTDTTLFNESVASLSSAVVPDTVDLQNNGGSGGTAITVNGTGAAGGAPDDDVDTNGAAAGGNPFVAINADPDSIVEFNLPVLNTSATPQSYNLQFTGNTPAGTPIGDTFDAGNGLPSGWQVEFLVAGAVVANTGVVASGGQVDVIARVSVPANALAGDQDIWFKVISATTGAFDVKLDRVTVNQIVDIEITPDQSAQAAPGGSAILSHTLNNVGNVGITDGAISFSTPFPTFAEDIFVDVNGNGVFDGADVAVASIADVLTAVGDANGSLDPGEDYTLFSRVQVPAAAIEGTSEQGTITVAANLTDAGGAPVTDANTANNAVTDPVTVVSGDVEVTKLAGVDTDCDGTLDVAFQQSQLAVDPTQCIVYQITATNTGTDNALNVEIRDATPAFTTYEDIAGFASVSTTGAGPATLTAEPAQGATGDVLATFGTLAPGDVAVLTFTVEVDGNLPNNTAGASTPIQ